MTRPGSGLWQELKRRRVFRVAGVYLVAGWVAVEVSATIFPMMGLPDWAPRLVLGLAIVGFPVSVALAWAFQVTPDGVRRTPPPGGAPGDDERMLPASKVLGPVRPRRTFIGVASILVLTVLVGGVLGYAVYFSVGDGPAAGSPANARSVAVLPFADMSAAGDQEYFADGLAEELLNALAQVEGLRVAARTSSFAFKGRDRDAREIGRTLGVNTLLEGSVRKAGDSVRISAQLVDAEDGYRLWSATYDGSLENVFGLQDQIARAIMNALQLELLGGDTTPLVREATASVEAHDLYLLGLHHWHRRGGALDSALAYFRRAVDIDPGYAPAHAGLAATYAVKPVFDPALPPSEALERGRAAARRALALDPDLPEAHAALGQLVMNFERDWEAAERHYRRAIARHPNYATAHQWLAELLYRVGRLDEAAREIENALALDPLSPVARWAAAIIYGTVGRVDEALRAADRATEIAPGTERANLYPGLAALVHGRTDAGTARMARLGRTSAEADAYAAIAEAYGDVTARPRAVAAVDAIARGRWGPRRFTDDELALLYAVAGADDRAVALLRAAERRRAPNLPVNMVAIAMLGAVREHPGFRRLARELEMEWLLQRPPQRASAR